MGMGDRIFIMSRAYSERARAEHDRIFGKKPSPAIGGIVLEDVPAERCPDEPMASGGFEEMEVRS